jgi:hypothetical protein
MAPGSNSNDHVNWHDLSTTGDIPQDDHSEIATEPATNSQCVLCRAILGP